MVLDRTDDEEHLTLPNPKTRCKLTRTSCTFGTPKIYPVHGYDGIILEVSELSHVVCVTLF